VVLLNLNPGFKEAEVPNHSAPYFSRLSRANLLHQQSDYPFYLLDPKLVSLGRRWWERKLRGLIEAVGREAVARNVLCVEYFPYHSLRFKRCKSLLPTQLYSWGLVQAAIRRNALVVLMRSKALWFSAVPELARYSRLYCVRSVQNPAISRRNCPDAFQNILAALQEASTLSPGQLTQQATGPKPARAWASRTLGNMMGHSPLRSTVLGLLRLLSDRDAQIAYEREVPIADVPAELLCMFNDQYLPKTYLFQSAFTPDERAVLAVFHERFTEVADALPRDLTRVADLHAHTEWRSLMRAAADALNRVGDDAV
jgi:hypothetical protein